MGVKLIVAIALTLGVVVKGDMMRKSIVFDIKTPKVFYCPQEKPDDLKKMIVKSIPLDKLCEYQGQNVPKNSRSDCYNDIDETEYACAEKQRILLRVNPPNDSDTTTVIPSPDMPEYIKINKKDTGLGKPGKSKKY
ncbi:uncharacterized protein LOC128398190 [Panonychus citri]|uniref:uncharacterized protein LOC128397335 n=1 Tax=Panonychus citri TaxID=50023 RepID=UPI002307ACE9|nr:uncharacterized protein LOC128397335 [Panonychus citri]XP_053214995.1 uncharacterized protein LOC128398190 [Panonychus citri]